MLGVLRREELTDVCVVATRYFGGILLGAGGLTRAYAKAAKIAVDAAGILEMRMCKLLQVGCPYAVYDKLWAAIFPMRSSVPTSPLRFPARPMRCQRCRPACRRSAPEWRPAGSAAKNLSVF